MNLNSRFTQPMPANLPADCFTCAVIDEQGREIPITEAMILQACRALDQAREEEPQTSMTPSARTCAASSGA